MNADLWSAAVNLLANGTSWASTKTAVEAMSGFPSTGEGSLMDTSEALLLAQAARPLTARAAWYLSSSPRQNGAAGGKPGLPSLFANPNGSYATTPYTATSLSVTANQTQTDPWGGTTASKLTLTGASAQHKIGWTFAGTTVTFTAKQGTAKYVGITFSGGTNYITVQLDNGTVTSHGAVVTGIATAVGSGFYTITYQEAAGSAAIISFGDTQPHAVPGTTWTAAGTETFFLCNVQGV